MRAANADNKPVLHVVEAQDQAPAALQRARGTARLSFKLAGTRTVLIEAHVPNPGAKIPAGLSAR